MVILICSFTQLICSLVILRIYVKSRHTPRKPDPDAIDFLSDVLVSVQGMEDILNDIRNAVDRGK